MRFEGRIYRPPSEAESVLIQLTVGCSHNRCAFCAMYADKKYRVRPLEEVMEDVDASARLWPRARRVFVCDGDALSAGHETFSALCAHIGRRFPALERISAYTNARDILRLSPEELDRLRELRFFLCYLGLESGGAAVLERIRKGASPEDMVEMAEKARAAGMDLSAIVLLGAGGRALTADHVSGTIAVVNRMRPRYLSFLTAMIVPHTALMAWTREGAFQPLTDREILREAREMLAGLELDDTLFRMNHVSNLIALGGRLPRDRAALLAQLDALIPRAGDRVTSICDGDQAMFL
ncbi:MAG TPA: radical SAM protein [Candidatus Hydrogenedentes bacterium]|nr:radical SAM protein [Candidatus Hydrogenedentota bacterium]